MGTTLPKILYVEDDEILRQATVRILSRSFEVAAAENGVEALSLLQANDYDAILSDIQMPEMDGVTFYERVAERKPEMIRRFVFLSGGWSTEMGLRLDRIPERKLLSKPCQLDELQTTLFNVVRQTEKTF